MKARSLRRRFTAAVLVGAALVLGIVELNFAAKPGGGSVPPGRIHYRWSSAISAEGGITEFRGWWSMNADGSDKRLAPYQPVWSDGRHHLTYREHQGRRWYLEVTPRAVYSRRRALTAVRDDGDPAFDLVLAEAAELPGNPTLSHCRWGRDDSLVSFAGIASIVQENGFPAADPDALAEIWAADVAFDELTGLPELISPPVADVMRISASGGSPINLTKDIDGYATSFEWR